MSTTNKSITIRFGEPFQPKSHISINYTNLSQTNPAVTTPANQVQITFGCQSNVDPFALGELNGMLETFVQAGLSEMPISGITFASDVQQGFYAGDPTTLKWTFGGIEDLATEGPPGEIIAMASQVGVPTASVHLNLNGDLNQRTDDWIAAELVVNADVRPTEMLKGLLRQAPEELRLAVLFGSAVISFSTPDELKEWGLWPEDLDDVTYSNVEALIKKAAKLVFNQNGVKVAADMEELREPFGTIYDQVQNCFTGCFTITLNVLGHEIVLESTIPFLTVLPQSFDSIGAEILSS
eukprot:TRINITY_DN13519_c0_g1_i1.p1 TRINITY_DN13519_c0_g1~~TRINITY_DN13519_c0_g1_i1.p1  ORF type:complete len:308 (-),score=75.08 TRINITY_DN13519_c0_g1_i1:25-909(-)